MSQATRCRWVWVPSQQTNTVFPLPLALGFTVKLPVVFLPDDS